MTSCNKEKNQDVLKVGYQFNEGYVVDGTLPSGATISVYWDYLSYLQGNQDQLMFTGTANEEVTVDGFTVPGLEAVTGTKDFTEGTSGQFYIKVEVNDTISNISAHVTNTLGIDYDNMRVSWDSGNDRKRDVFKSLMEVVVTYENWWNDAQWRLDSTSLNGVSGTPATCAEDNILYTGLHIDGNSNYNIKYDEGTNVCSGANQEEKGSIVPYMSPAQPRELEISFVVYDNISDDSFVFNSLKFRSKDLITLVGEVQTSGDPVQYFFSRI